MFDKNTIAYIFVAPISHAYVPKGKVKKICDPTRKENRLFLDYALTKEEEDSLDENQIIYVLPDEWLSEFKVHPIMNYSVEANTAVSKKAKQYLFNNDIVTDKDELDALDDSILLFNYHRIIFFVYFIDSATKKVIMKKVPPKKT